jgi:hypothetical protein
MVPVALAVNVGGTDVVGLLVTATGPGIGTPAPSANLAIGVDGVASGTISLPSGANRAIRVSAFDSRAIETHRGTRSVDIVTGTNPTVTIVLYPLNGDQPIEVLFGSVVISVAPATISVPSGATGQLTATVTGADGIALDALVSWASLSPDIVSVDAEGTVMAHASGSAQVVATYGRVGASATVIVPE